MSTFDVLIPWVYLVESRLRRRIERVSWVLINPVPIGAAAWWVADLPTGVFAAAVALAFAAWQSVYETGYLENDIVTTRTEANPTLRLASARHRVLERHYVAVVGGKLAVGVVTVGALYALAVSVRADPSPDLARPDLARGVALFAGLLVVSRLAFLAHNALRSRANILTYFVVASLKYVAIPVLFAAPSQRLGVALVMIAVFPVIRTVENACSPKHRLDRLAKAVGDVDVFRPLYYSLVALGFGAATLVQNSTVLRLGFTLAAYFFVLRLAALVMSRTTHRGFRAS